MSPIALAKTVVVQFVGENREALRYEKGLCVSVQKLRRAFQWLSLNSWPFMEATRHHELWETGSLDPAFETLLEEYFKSTGTRSGGVPCEVLQVTSINMGT